MNRRELLATAGGLVAAACQKSTAHPEGADPLLGTTLMHDVSTYTAFGRHRSGSSGDVATSSWISDRWTALGYDVQQTEFDTPNADTFRANLTIDGRPIDGFAQPPMAFSPEGGLRGVLAEWQEAFPSNVQGRIAVVYIPRAGGGALPNNPASPAYHAAFKAAEAAGAIGVVAIIASPSKEIVALNTPVDGVSKIPILSLGEAMKPAIDAAVAANGKEAILRIEGQGGTRKAKTTVARHGKSGPWLIVSTPQSGWFNCGGERGPGVAISLALSEWALRQKFQNRLLFVATSGHEWNDAGAHIFHEKDAPDPADTAFWFHLGASFGARNYQDDGTKFVPLDEPNPQRVFMVSEDLMAPATEAFAGQPVIENPTPGSVERSAGELTLVIKEGYKSYAGFFGAHALFHTPFDDDTATTPALMEPLARSCAKLIEARLRRA